ncbi:MAG: hypothetical protein AB8B72_10095 [Crocinitomicaceae bacterium]
MKNKIVFFVIALSTVLSIISCSWHRNEIAYVTTTYIQQQQISSSDSIQIHSISKKTKHQDQYSFIENKFQNLETGELSYERRSTTKFEEISTSVKSYPIDPTFYFETVKNNNVNSSSMRFKYQTLKDTLSRKYNINSIGIYKSDSVLNDSAILEVTYDSKIGFENKRYFNLDSNTISHYSAWIQKAVNSDQPIPFPTSIISSYKLTFAKSTSFETEYLNSDSTHSNTLKIDSLYINEQLKVNSKVISTQKREKLDSIPNAYYSLFKTDYTFRETISKGSAVPPMYLKEYRINPVNSDTIFRRMITSNKWDDGRRFKVTVNGYISDFGYYNQNAIENKINSREILFYCDLNNKLKAYDIISISVEGDTFNYSEELTTYGTWKVTSNLKNGKPYYFGRPDYLQLTPFNKSYIMPMRRNFYVGSPWFKKELIVREKNYSKKELRKIEKKEKRSYKNRGRTYRFCMRVFGRTFFCIPHFNSRNGKVINYEKKSRKASKPDYYKKETKRLERNRKNGYEKRIKTFSYNNDYYIYEIYYKNIGVGNKLEPLTN